MRKLLESTFEDEKTVEAIAEEIYTLGMRVVTRLESHFKDMCELALDVAVDRSGHVWLLEVNPKPAREVFRRIGEQEIYRNAIIRPLEYAIYLYEQSKLQEESKRKKEKKQEKKEGA